MNKKYLLFLSGLAFAFLLSGCVVRTYSLTRDRVDQDIKSGNRGYVSGQTTEDKELAQRKTTRTTQVVEVELHAPVKFEKMPKSKPPKKTSDDEVWGNRGYITQKETTPRMKESLVASVTIPVIENYTVRKNETLQKISQKFYGTTKRWLKIYDANRDVLKGPNKIYPGQVLRIPLEGSGKKTEALRETEENLK